MLSRTTHASLATVLSRLVLSHETILRHAQSTLRAPELLQIPARASALDLWSAVLGRAQAEGVVERLVESVLDENPAAEQVRKEFRHWSFEQANAVSHDTAIAGVRRASVPTASSSLGVQPIGAAGARVLAATVAVTIGGAALWARGERPRSEPTAQELEVALLECWRATEGGAPEHPESSIRLALLKDGAGAEGVSDVDSAAFERSPGFRRCAEQAVASTLTQMPPGAHFEVKTILPGRREHASIPSADEAREEILACWAGNEGSVPGTPGWWQTVSVKRGSHSLSGHPNKPRSPGFDTCLTRLLTDYGRRANVLDQLRLEVHFPPAPARGEGAGPALIRGLGASVELGSNSMSADRP